jgi:hypothetical protein
MLCDSERPKKLEKDLYHPYTPNQTVLSLECAVSLVTVRGDSRATQATLLRHDNNVPFTPK